MSVSSAKSAGGAENHVGMGCLRMVNDGEFRLTVVEQRQRVDQETGNDVELDFRPEGPVGIHGRHQPVEAIVALHRHAQRSGVTLSQASDVPSCLGHLRQHRAGQGEQALTNGRKSQGPDVFFDQCRPIVAFERFQLVRQGGLGKEQARRRLGQAAALGQRQQGLQVSKLQGRG